MELRFVASMVLDAVANDYETIAQVVSDVTEHARSLNLPVERTEIIDALGALVEQGFVKA